MANSDNTPPPLFEGRASPTPSSPLFPGARSSASSKELPPSSLGNANAYVTPPTNSHENADVVQGSSSSLHMYQGIFGELPASNTRRRHPQLGSSRPPAGTGRGGTPDELSSDEVEVQASTRPLKRRKVDHGGLLELSQSPFNAGGAGENVSRSPSQAVSPHQAKLSPMPSPGSVVSPAELFENENDKDDFLDFLHGSGSENEFSNVDNEVARAVSSAERREDQSVDHPPAPESAPRGSNMHGTGSEEPVATPFRTQGQPSRRRQESENENDDMQNKGSEGPVVAPVWTQTQPSRSPRQSEDVDNDDVSSYESEEEHDTFSPAESSASPPPPSPQKEVAADFDMPFWVDLPPLPVPAPAAAPSSRPQHARKCPRPSTSSIASGKNSKRSRKASKGSTRSRSRSSSAPKRRKRSRAREALTSQSDDGASDGDLSASASASEAAAKPQQRKKRKVSRKNDGDGDGEASDQISAELEKSADVILAKLDKERGTTDAADTDGSESDLDLDDKVRVLNWHHTNSVSHAETCTEFDIDYRTLTSLLRREDDIRRQLEERANSEERAGGISPHTKLEVLRWMRESRQSASKVERRFKLPNGVLRRWSSQRVMLLLQVNASHRRKAGDECSAAVAAAGEKKDGVGVDVDVVGFESDSESGEVIVVDGGADCDEETKRRIVKWHRKYGELVKKTSAQFDVEDGVLRQWLEEAGVPARGRLTNAFKVSVLDALRANGGDVVKTAEITKTSQGVIRKWVDAEVKIREELDGERQREANKREKREKRVPKRKGREDAKDQKAAKRRRREPSPYDDVLCDEDVVAGGNESQSESDDVILMNGGADCDDETKQKILAWHRKCGEVMSKTRKRFGLDFNVLKQWLEDAGMEMKNAYSNAFKVSVLDAIRSNPDRVLKTLSTFFIRGPTLQRWRQSEATIREAYENEQVQDDDSPLDGIVPPEDGGVGCDSETREKILDWHRKYGEIASETSDAFQLDADVFHGWLREEGMPVRRRHPTSFKVGVLDTLRENSGDVRKTIKQTRVSYAMIARWRANAVKLREALERELADEDGRRAHGESNAKPAGSLGDADGEAYGADGNGESELESDDDIGNESDSEKIGPLKNGGEDCDEETRAKVLEWHKVSGEKAKKTIDKFGLDRSVLKAWLREEGLGWNYYNYTNAAKVYVLDLYHELKQSARKTGQVTHIGRESIARWVKDEKKIREAFAAEKAHDEEHEDLRNVFESPIEADDMKPLEDGGRNIDADATRNILEWHRKYGEIVPKTAKRFGMTIARCEKFLADAGATVRRKYTDAFKVLVLDALHKKGDNIQQTAAQTTVSKPLVTNWMRDEAKIRERVAAAAAASAAARDSAPPVWDNYKSMSASASLKYTDEYKLDVVAWHRAHGGTSVERTARLCGPRRPTIYLWIENEDKIRKRVALRLRKAQDALKAPVLSGGGSRHTPADKLRVLEYHRAHGESIESTSRNCGIDRTTLRRWLFQGEHLIREELDAERLKDDERFDGERYLEDKKWVYTDAFKSHVLKWHHDHRCGFATTARNFSLRAETVRLWLVAERRNNSGRSDDRTPPLAQVNLASTSSNASAAAVSTPSSAPLRLQSSNSEAREASSNDAARRGSHWQDASSSSSATDRSTFKPPPIRSPLGSESGLPATGDPENHDSQNDSGSDSSLSFSDVETSTPDREPPADIGSTPSERSAIDGEGASSGRSVIPIEGASSEQNEIDAEGASSIDVHISELCSDLRADTVLYGEKVTVANAAPGAKGGAYPLAFKVRVVEWHERFGASTGATAARCRLKSRSVRLWLKDKQCIRAQYVREKKRAQQIASISRRLAELPFASEEAGHRKLPIEEKLRIVEWHKSSGATREQTARACNISRRCLGGWLAREGELRAELAARPPEEAKAREDAKAREEEAKANAAAHLLPYRLADLASEKKRRMFSIEEKLRVVEWHKASGATRAQTARACNVTQKSLFRWLVQEGELRSQLAAREEEVNAREDANSKAAAAREEAARAKAAAAARENAPVNAATTVREDDQKASAAAAAKAPPSPPGPPRPECRASKFQAHSLTFKLRVIDWHRAHGATRIETARACNISARCLRHWLAREGELRSKLAAQEEVKAREEDAKATATRLADRPLASEKKCRMISIEEKLRVVEWHKASGGTRAQSARACNISRRSLRRWLAEEEELRSKLAALGEGKAREGEVSGDAAKAALPPPPRSEHRDNKFQAHPLTFKLRVIDWHRAHGNGLMQDTARACGITCGRVSKWLATEDKLRAQASDVSKIPPAPRHNQKQYPMDYKLRVLDWHHLYGTKSNVADTARQCDITAASLRRWLREEEAMREAQQAGHESLAERERCVREGARARVVPECPRFAMATNDTGDFPEELKNDLMAWHEEFGTSVRATCRAANVSTACLSRWLQMKRRRQRLQQLRTERDQLAMVSKSESAPDGGKSQSGASELGRTPAMGSDLTPSVSGRVSSSPSSAREPSRKPETESCLNDGVSTEEKTSEAAASQNGGSTFSQSPTEAFDAVSVGLSDDFNLHSETKIVPASTSSPTGASPAVASGLGTPHVSSEAGAVCEGDVGAQGGGIPAATPPSFSQTSHSDTSQISALQHDRSRDSAAHVDESRESPLPEESVPHRDVLYGLTPHPDLFRGPTPQRDILRKSLSQLGALHMPDGARTSSRHSGASSGSMSHRDASRDLPPISDVPSGSIPHRDASRASPPISDVPSCSIPRHDAASRGSAPHSDDSLRSVSSQRPMSSSRKMSSDSQKSTVCADSTVAKSPSSSSSTATANPFASDVAGVGSPDRNVTSPLVANSFAKQTPVAFSGLRASPSAASAIETESPASPSSSSVRATAASDSHQNLESSQEDDSVSSQGESIQKDTQQLVTPRGLSAVAEDCYSDDHLPLEVDSESDPNFSRSPSPRRSHPRRHSAASPAIRSSDVSYGNSNHRKSPASSRYISSERSRNMHSSPTSASSRQLPRNSPNRGLTSAFSTSSLQFRHHSPLRDSISRSHRSDRNRRPRVESSASRSPSPSRSRRRPKRRSVSPSPSRPSKRSHSPSRRRSRSRSRSTSRRRYLSKSPTRLRTRSNRYPHPQSGIEGDSSRRRDDEASRLFHGDSSRHREDDASRRLHDDEDEGDDSDLDSVLSFGSFVGVEA